MRNNYMNGFKKALYIGGLVLALTGCKKENNPPTNSVSPDPISGEAPLLEKITNSYNDIDGLSDIVDYNMLIKNTTTGKVDTSINGSDPIPTFNRTYKTPGKYEITFKVTDSHGASAISTATFDVLQGKYVNLNTELVDYNKIKLSATVSKANNAKLTVKKNNSIILTKDIADVYPDGAQPDYIQTFDYPTDGFTKGDYSFEIVADGVDKKASTITISNYEPTANFSGTNFDLKEYSQKSFTLPDPIDKNPEDNPVSYTGAVSTDGRTVVALNGKNLIVTSKAPNPYQGKLTFGTTAGGTGSINLEGIILVDPRPKVFPYRRPNIRSDAEWNSYGSGFITKDKIRDVNDLNRLTQIINGTFSDPADKWLMYRCDVNGDGAVNSMDIDLLSKKINGTILYLPSEWDMLLTRAEGEDWLKKMLVIDKTNFITTFPPGDPCKYFADQLYLNFHGASSTDIPKFLSVFPYDTTKIGLFNIPMYEVILAFNENPDIREGHMMNVVCFDDDAFKWTSNCTIEPNNDNMNVQAGQGLFRGTKTTYGVQGLPIISSNTIVEFDNYYGFHIVDNVPTIISYESALVKFMNLRSDNKK